MIGKVVFRYNSAIVEAVMDDDGAWSCDAIPCLIRPLNTLYTPLSRAATLDRSRCKRCLESAARWLRGEARAGHADGESRCGDRPVHGHDRLDLRVTNGLDLSSAWMRLK
jgi:hypothetical protein